jgi:DNA (cytosine-5)-methyltransferase 1
LSRPIAVDLFAGAGGLSLGFEWAGFKVVAAVEYDPIHCATHEFNFPECSSICRSVSDINGDFIRSNSTIGTADIDVVFGGAPCQGFSLIGKRCFDDPRNRLVYDFVRLVAELQPKYFVFENVKGLTIGEHKRFLHEVIEEFQRRGYSVREDYNVLNAARFGVPQDRQRLFLFGARQGLRLPSYPMPTHRLPHKTNGDEELSVTPTVWEAIGDLPDPDSFPELLERDWVYARFGKANRYSKQLRVPPERGPLRLLTSSLRTVHTALSTRRFKATALGAVEPVSRFMRLDPNGLCNTLRAGTGTDRGAFTSPRPIHPSSPRCITVREAARLHSYPDWFRFHVTKWHGFRQVGNSVPPLLARAVAMEVTSCLRRKSAELTAGFDRLLGRPELLAFNMSEAAAHYRVPANIVPPRRRGAAEAAYA